MGVELVAVVGSRRWDDAAPVRAAVREFVAALAPDTVVITGGALGVDTWAEGAARRRGLSVVVIRPEWNRYGRRAAFLRDREIAETADRVVAFWDGASKGTAHTVRLARDLGREVEVFDWSNPESVADLLLDVDWGDVWDALPEVNDPGSFNR